MSSTTIINYIAVFEVCRSLDSRVAVMCFLDRNSLQNQYWKHVPTVVLHAEKTIEYLAHLQATHRLILKLVRSQILSIVQKKN